MYNANVTSRVDQVQNAIQLEYFTIFYNLLEAVASLILGGMANSIALIGFGVDSFIEGSSGIVVLVRFRSEARGNEEHAVAERRALRFVGWSLLLLVFYVVFESVRKLWFQEQPDASPLGILLAVLSIIVMPILARKKNRTGQALESRALISDSKQTLACSLLSVALLIGLSLNALWGWWWADPIAALAMVPWIASEGKEAIQA